MRHNPIMMGTLVAVALIIIVVATGGTFGQRCNRAYPDNPARAEQCVYNLNHGVAP